MKPFSIPVFLQISFLVTYAIFSILTFNREHSLSLVFLCIAFAVFLHFGINKIFYKSVVPPFSAIITGLACFLLIESSSTLIYIGCISISLFSKVFFVFEKRHLFNPANFGVSTILLWFPAVATSGAATFNGQYIPSICFFLFGLCTSYFARQLILVGSWVFAFIFFSYLSSLIQGMPHSGLTTLSLLSPPMLLFTFHMLTDPSTTPRTRIQKILFGAAVAFLDAVLRYFEIHNSPFFSLLVCCSFNPFWRKIK